MNTNSKRLGIYLAVMLILTAIATTLRTIAAIMQLDYRSGFYSEGTLIGAANVIVTLTVIGMFTYMLTAKRIKLKASFSTGATYVPTGILGVASAFIGIKTFYYILNISNYRLLVIKEKTIAGIIRELLTAQNMTAIIGILASVLAFVSIAHHFLSAFVTESKDVTRAYFAIVSISFLSLYAILIYLDGSIALNESGKVLRQTSFLLLALFFLYEARISLGREMWRIYTSFGLVAATLTAYTAIPALVTYFVNGEIISAAGSKSLASAEEYIFLLAAFIFTVSRLCLTATLKEERDNELVLAFGQAARDREARVNEAEEIHREIFASKQLSFFDLSGEAEAEEDTAGEVMSAQTEDADCEKTITISDDAIYESIYGKMPEKPVEVAEEEPDNRKPDEIAEDLLKLYSDTAENESNI